MVFNERSGKAQDIMRAFEVEIRMLGRDFEFTLKEPAHDIARRFLNEIEEFEAVKE